MNEERREQARHLDDSLATSVNRTRRCTMNRKLKNAAAPAKVDRAQWALIGASSSRSSKTPLRSDQAALPHRG